jgi:hypothetical protein
MVDILVNFLVATELEEKFETWWLEITTAILMPLAVPGDRLRLGDPVPPWPNSACYPNGMRSSTLPQLQHIVAHYENLPAGDGQAEHWDVLSARTNYAVQQMTRHQQDAGLWLPPFTDEESEGIDAGQAPAGAS